MSSQVIIAVVATKGGTGKTTLAANTAGLLADLNCRVLCIDADVQPSLSKYYPLHKTAKYGIVELLLGDNSESTIQSCISNTIFPNLDIVLSNNISPATSKSKFRDGRTDRFCCAPNLPIR